jgi:hypothetical protein
MTNTQAQQILIGIETHGIITGIMPADGQIIEHLVFRASCRRALDLLRLAEWSASRIAVAFQASGWTQDGFRR